MNDIAPQLPAILGTIIGGLVLIIPIAGFTLRFAIKPITEAVLRMREAQAGQGGREVAVLEQRVSLLEQQVLGIERSVERLVEARDFDRQLTAPKS